MKTKSFVIYFIIVGLVLKGSVTKLGAKGSSEEVVEVRIMVRGWEIITIRESSDFIYIRCEAAIDSVEQLEAYKNSRIDLLHNISNVMNPEDEIGAQIVFNYPISFNESIKLATKYEFPLRFFEYISNKGSRGGMKLLPGETLEEREEQLKQVLGTDYEIIGITMLHGRMPVMSLLTVQNEPIVFLVDIGPPEFYEELSKVKKVMVSRPNIYSALTKSLPLTTSTLPITTLYMTYTSSTTTPPFTPESFVIPTPVTVIIHPSFVTNPRVTTELTSTTMIPSTKDSFLATKTAFTPLTTTSQPSIQVEEFRYNGFFVVLELIVLFTGLQLLRLSHHRV